MIADVSFPHQKKTKRLLEGNLIISLDKYLTVCVSEMIAQHNVFSYGHFQALPPFFYHECDKQ